MENLPPNPPRGLCLSLNPPQGGRDLIWTESLEAPPWGGGGKTSEVEKY